MVVFLGFVFGVFEVLGCRVWVWDWDSGFGFWVLGFGFWFSGLGFRVLGLGFGFWVWSVED